MLLSVDLLIKKPRTCISNDYFEVGGMLSYKDKAWNKFKEIWAYANDLEINVI